MAPLSAAQDVVILTRLGDDAVYWEAGAVQHDVKGLFSNPYAGGAMDVDMVVNATTIKCLAADLPGLDTTARFTVGAIDYDVIRVNANGHGWVLIELREV